MKAKLQNHVPIKKGAKLFLNFSKLNSTIYSNYSIILLSGIYPNNMELIQYMKNKSNNTSFYYMAISIETEDTI